MKIHAPFDYIFATLYLRYKNGARYGVIRFAPFSLRAYPGFENAPHNSIHFAAADFFALLEH